jgi:hypothetical protein
MEWGRYNDFEDGSIYWHPDEMERRILTCL